MKTFEDRDDLPLSYVLDMKVWIDAEPPKIRFIKHRQWKCEKPRFGDYVFLNHGIGPSKPTPPPPAPYCRSQTPEFKTTPMPAVKPSKPE